MKIGINWIHTFSPSLKGKWENLLHYSVKPIYPEHSKITCTKHGYISTVHLQYRNTYRTPHRQADLQNCTITVYAIWELNMNRVTLPHHKNSHHSHFTNQMCFQRPPPAPKAAQTTSPFKPKSTSPPLSSFIYLSSYNIVVDSVNCIF